MGYQVEYGVIHDGRSKKWSALVRLICMCAASFGLFVFLTKIFWPEGWMLMKLLIIPDLQVWSALDAFAEDLELGRSFMESAACFCHEIMDHAEILH